MENNKLLDGIISSLDWDDNIIYNRLSKGSYQVGFSHKIYLGKLIEKYTNSFKMIHSFGYHWEKNRVKGNQEIITSDCPTYW